jgi:hypothetical protein
LGLLARSDLWQGDCYIALRDPNNFSIRSSPRFFGSDRDVILGSRGNT